MQSNSKQSLQILIFTINLFFYLILLLIVQLTNHQRKINIISLQLSIQYIRYMNFSRADMKNQYVSSEMYSITRNQPNYSSAQHKTSRKNSLQNRVCLGQLPLNRFDSGSKECSINLKRQSSIEMKKSNNKNTSMNGSRWLNNQKQMMQFILNLKSKKSDSNQGKKYCQEFQMAENAVEKEELLCNRMLIIKKVEKHEKEAISYFYQKIYEKSFEQLSKAQNLMKKQRIDSQQHQLYINYLYAEFYYKLQNHQKWKSYLIKSKSLVSRLSSHQNTSMKEYILSIKALEVCLSLKEQHFQKTLRQIEQIKDSEKISSKIRRRVAHAQITALRKLCRFRLALELIDKQFVALQHDQQLNQDKKESQFSKLFQLKIQITIQFVSNQKAIELIESLIGFEEVSKGQKNNFSYYNVRIYNIFAELLDKIVKEKIKLIFFYQKWAQFQTCKKQKLKVQLQLFKIYYELGIYQKALQLFDSISSQNVVYLGPQYLFMFANIKHFNGEISEAVSICIKIIDICDDDESKAIYLFKILQFNLQELAEKLRSEREMLLQNFLKSLESGTCALAIDLYTEYLKQRGEADRAKKFASSFKKGGNFSISNILQSTSNRRKMSKK